MASDSSKKTYTRPINCRLVASWGRQIPAHLWALLQAGTPLATIVAAESLRQAVEPLPRGWEWAKTWFRNGRVYVAKVHAQPKPTARQLAARGEIFVHPRAYSRLREILTSRAKPPKTPAENPGKQLVDAPPRAHS